jgi:glycosyltransferase involved in cell wall biosynthesis
VTPQPRLLMLGSVNHPHVEHLAVAMHERGFAVTVAGDVVAGLAASALPAQGIAVISAPAVRRGSLRGLIEHVRWIRRLLRGVKPHVVHAHWLCGFAFFAALARASPLVAMAWGSDVLRARPAQTVANRIALRRAELAMADSEALLDRLVELGADRERTVLVNWGVDLRRFAPVTAAERGALKRALGLGPGPVVLSPRSLMPVYNPQTILDAFGLLADEFGDVQLVVKHMGVVTAELGDFPHPERVHVVDHVPYERMPDYYRAADVCVSIASSDSSPRSVWEAMACGTPCVLSALPWVDELIVPEEDALVVPVEPASVAAAVRRILTDAELASRLAERGRRLTERHRDRGAEMDRLASLYRGLID